MRRIRIGIQSDSDKCERIVWSSKNYDRDSQPRDDQKRMSLSVERSFVIISDAFSPRDDSSQDLDNIDNDRRIIHILKG
jgi:hypothetical protein